MTPEEAFSELYPIARAAARAVYGGNQDYADMNDLIQEAMLWLLEHPKRVDNHTLPSGRLHFPGLLAEVTAFLHRLVDKERREAIGYDPSDCYEYSAGLVALVLPAVFDPEYRPPGLDNSDRVTTTSDPAAADNWTAFVVDVKRAVDAVCSDRDRRVLFTRSIGDWTWAKFGEAYPQSEKSYRLRYHAAVDRICAFLNAGATLLDSPDAGALADAFAGPAPVARAQTRTDWDTVGRDRYVEPDA